MWVGEDNGEGFQELVVLTGTRLSLEPLLDLIGLSTHLPCLQNQMIKLFGKPLRVNKASSDKKQVDVGANLFVGNLDPAVDERTLYDTFSQFGLIVQPPKIARDTETGNSRGFGFVSFDDFDASDAALEAMNGQHLMGKQIKVSYALKKDGKGEAHGSAAERLLASQRKKNMATQPPAMVGFRG